VATKERMGGMLMRQSCVAVVVAAGLLSAGCGGSDGAAVEASTRDATVGETTSSSGDGLGDGAGGTTVVDPPPPGHATVSVDGQEFNFELPGAVDCLVSTEAFRFSYRIGDNEVTLGAGANRYDETGWAGAISMIVAEPVGESGPVTYSPATGAMTDEAFAFDGDSMSYSGPMQKTPPNDGSNPPPIDVGEGTITATCP
jgi:hypothetical protein